MENLHKKENLYKHIETFFRLSGIVLMGLIIFEFYSNKKVYLALEEAVKKNKLTLNKELDLYERQDSFFKYSHYIENPDGSYNFIFKKYEVLKN